MCFVIDCFDVIGNRGNDVYFWQIFVMKNRGIDVDNIFFGNEDMWFEVNVVIIKEFNCVVLGSNLNVWVWCVKNGYIQIFFEFKVF